jgi:DNA-binding beta-propeller fold protein YncE/tRNA A-37 threonylcarbamoyl transferase component Bud32
MGEEPTPAVLVKLLCSQQQQCWQRGQRTQAESYLEQYPTLAENPTCAVELIFQEFLLREQLGEAPRPEEFVQRFPQFAQQLKLVFQVDRQIGEEWPPEAAAPARTEAAAGMDRPPSADYEIVGELGRGGSSVVYQARQLGLNRMVALKRIRDGTHAGSEQRQRFRIEAEAIARLQHPHIVQIFEVGEEDGGPYFSLEFMEGGSLAAKLGGNPQPARAAAQLVQRLARAMQAAHAQGIIHRDLKPANVLLTSDGTPKISDFGLAKLLTGAGGVETQSGAIVGTPSYMAPEQAEGKTRAIGPATDIYALGAILYELLTGRPPFRAETALETLHQIQGVEPVPPSRLQPKSPRDLETITLKCLAKEPARRYQTAGELAEELQRWLEGRPIQARPVGVLGRAWRWCRRKPGLSGAVGAAAFFLVLGTLVSSLLALRALAEARRADRETAGARANEQLVREGKQFSDRRYYASEMKLASLDWEAGQPGLVQQRLRKFEPQDGDDDLRSFEWYYLQRLCQLDLRTLRGHTGEVLGVAFSPDGRRLASASLDGTVRVWDTATGQPVLTLKRHTDGVNGVAFSPDGKHLASASRDQTVKVWDAATGQEILSLKGHTRQVTGVAFSPVDRRLASASQDGTVRVWDLATRQKRLTFQGHTRGAWGVAFSPDGKQLASASFDGTVRVWDATGRVIRTLKGHTDWALGVPFSPAFSPDGRRLASASRDNTVKVWDAATGQETLSLPGHTGWVYGVAFSPDGRRLASASQDGTVRLWDAATGQEVLCLKGHKNAVWGVAFSPDGKQLASASLDQTVKVWDATDLTPERLIECEARGLVQFLFAKLLLPDEVAAAVRRDPTITATVRKQALAWVEPCWRMQVRAEAARLVGPVFAKPMLRSQLRSEVLAMLRVDARLRPAVRQEALRLAESLPENALPFNNASWAVVRQPGADASAYQRALRQAEIVCRLARNNVNLLNTRGVAYYRVGHYRQALQTLGLCIKLRKEPKPSDLAFLAMAQHHLGQKEQAQATFARLREVMKQPRWTKNAEAQGFLREAEAVLKTTPASGKSP